MATASFGLLLAAAASYVSAAELFTDYMATPALGVGSAAPTLSWASEPTALAVAATTVTWQALNLSTGEFETTWSTVVPGSSRVEYGGPALVSDRAYRWAVDGDGTWAAVRTGLLDHSEWSAAGAVFLGTPARQNLLRLPFNGSATPGAPLRTASLFITGQSWFEVYLNGARADPLRFFEPAQSVYQSRIVSWCCPVVRLFGECVGMSASMGVADRLPPPRFVLRGHHPTIPAVTRRNSTAGQHAARPHPCRSTARTTSPRS